MPLTRIILKDELADRFCPELRVDVNSVAEAVRMLEANYPDIRPYLATAHERGYGFEVYVGDWQIEEKHIFCATGRQEITIAPALIGSGGVFGKIILGIGLIALGVVTGGIGFISASSLILVGGTMALSGILGLFGQPKAQGKADDEKKASLIFGGGVNVASQGGRMALAYGGGGWSSSVYSDGLLVGSQVLSAAIRSWLTEDDGADDD
jgi:predicted phage tail protein